MSIFVQHSKKKKLSNQKKEMFHFRNTYGSVSKSGMRRTSHRFQTAEPGAEPGAEPVAEPVAEHGETKTPARHKTGKMGRFEDLLECLDTVGEDGMFESYKKNDLAIKAVEKDLWAKEATAKAAWLAAWKVVRTIESRHLPNSPLWDRVKVQSEIMARAWVNVNKEEMKNAGTKNKKIKENLDDFFETARAAHSDAEEDAYESYPWSKEGMEEVWHEARHVRLKAHKEWNRWFRESTWEIKKHSFNPEWSPSNEEYEMEQNKKGNTDNHDAQIKIRTWTRLVVKKLLVGKKIQVFYADSDDSPTGRWYNGTVSTAKDLGILYDDGDDLPGDDILDERLYIQLDDEGDGEENVVLHVLRIEEDDEEADRIRSPPKNTYEEEKEEEDTLRSDDNALSSSDEEDDEEDEEAGLIGIAVKKIGAIKYAYIGVITRRRPTPPGGVISGEEDRHQYEITCGSDHVIPNIGWNEGSKLWFLGGVFNIYQPDDYYQENDFFMGVKITRIYTKLAGQNAGEEMAVLERGADKPFKEMKKEQEDQAAHRAEEDENKEEEDDNRGPLLSPNTVFDYTDTDGNLYKVKWNPESKSVGNYLMYKTIEEFKEQTKKTEEEELDEVARQNYVALQYEKKMRIAYRKREKEEKEEKDASEEKEEEEEKDEDEEEEEEEEEEEDAENNDIHVSELDFISQYKKEHANATRTKAEWEELYSGQSELVNLITLDNIKKFNGVDASLLLIRTGSEGTDESDDSSDEDFEEAKVE